MKAIHADPKELRKIFAEKYVIPDFQRPYSWEKEQCDKLWEDFIDFYQSQTSKDDKYFLGNIVIHPSNGSYAVIDGQQRLTTLLLLINAFHSKAGTAVVLEECLRIKDPLTSQLTNELRLESLVIDNDKKDLYDIIFNNGKNTDDGRNIKKNYIDFCGKIDGWWKDNGYQAGELNKLILCLLDQVVILPIHCGSEDDALTIFETINNRGMSLTDSDIFKAKLHHAAGDEKDILVEKWNKIDNHEWLFRVLMHIIRAKENDTSKEIGLRSYFTDSKKFRLADWKYIMNCLTEIYDIEHNWGPTSQINILWFILYTYPNYYWNFPLFVFLHKYGKLIDETFELPEEYIPKFQELIECTVKYFFIKGVVYNSVNYVRDTVFKVCAAIELEQDYISEYTKTISPLDIEDFNRKLINKQYGRYLRGLVLLAAYLNPGQNVQDFEDFIVSTHHIEHILPQKWNNYDYWDEKTWADDINTLGNLIPLEYKLNIKDKNEFFNRKKEYYEQSKVQDAIELAKLDDWNPMVLQEMQDIKNKRLKKFFCF